MYTFDQLMEEYVDSERSLTDNQKSGRLSLKARGLPHYGVMRDRYNTHFVSFCNMHSRTTSVDSFFKRDLEGFLRFIAYLGPIPSDMKWPTLGRIDHSIGYYRGNFAWQEQEENSRECNTRHGYKLTYANTVNSVTLKRANFITFLNSLPKGKHRLEKTTHVDFGYKRIQEIRDSIKSSKVAVMLDPWTFEIV